MKQHFSSSQNNVSLDHIMKLTLQNMSLQVLLIPIKSTKVFVDTLVAWKLFRKQSPLNTSSSSARSGSVWVVWVILAVLNERNQKVGLHH